MTSAEDSFKREVSTQVGHSAVDSHVSKAAVQRDINMREPIGHLVLAAWSRVIATNFTSTFLLARADEAKLRAPRAVVTTASTRAYMSEAHAEAYSALKGSLVALTHALSISLAPHVRMNSLNPGQTAAMVGFAPTRFRAGLSPTADWRGTGPAARRRTSP